ncbi:PRC-barrel domain-containing protein [Kitasatospora sp. NPDC085879]|uniref:PRC-barrel domain-containing protein n=1 Tax=Kitasatospora sp. NPDC085879 TaxID=3154769 RepID=UPI003436E43F
MREQIWNHHPDNGHTEDRDVIGYTVQATDGRIGKVDRHSVEVDASYLVVDTGPWIFGRQVLLPAGTILRIDHEERTVLVNRSKDEIKGAPEFVSEHEVPADHLSALGTYYGPMI